MADGREGAQKRTFTRWVNHFLSEYANKDMKVDDLFTDFADGIKLNALISVISGNKKPGRITKHPRMLQHKLENLANTLDFLKKEGLVLVNIGAGDIHDGNSKCILGLIWTLILRYQIQVGGSDGSPKRKLLQWVNKQVKPYGLEAIDFTKSFTDGKILCALDDSLQKGLFDFGQAGGENGVKLTEDKVKNVANATKVALETFDIPELVEANDVVNHPDEHGMMTYVSYFRDFAANRKKELGNYGKFGPNSGESYAEGKGVSGGFCDRPLPFTIYSLNAEGEPANNPKYLGEWTVEVKGPSGKVDCKVRDNEDGTLSGEYSPTIPGKYEVAICVKRPKNENSQPEHIKGSIYQLEVKEGGEPSKSYAEGPGLTNAFDDQPAHFTVHVFDKHGNPVPGEDGLTVDITPTSGLGGGTGPVYDKECCQMATTKFCEECGAKVVPRSERGNSGTGNSGTGPVPTSPIIANIKDNGDGTYEVEYEGKEPGNFEVNVCIVDTPIKDMPCTLCVRPGADPKQTYVTGPGVCSPGFAGLPHPFTIHCVDPFGNPVEVGGHEFMPTVTDPNGKLVDCDIKDNGDGTYSGCYTPKDLGNYIVDLKMDKNGKLTGVKDNPFRIQVKEPADPSKTYAEGDGVEFAVDNRPNKFKVYAKDKNGKPVTGLTNGNWLDVIMTDPNADPNGETNLIKPKIQDNGDGSYDVEYEMDEPGDYQLDVKVADESIKDMPKKINCYPGVNAANTLVTGPGVTEGLPGPLEFTVQAKDKDGNNVPVGGDDFTANITGPDGEPVHCDIKDNGDGTYTGFYEPKEPGDYQVVLNVNDDPDNVGNSPYTCTVGAGSDPGKSYCKGPGWKYAYDNKPTNFTVHCFDEEGKPVIGEKIKVKLIQMDDKKQKSCLEKLICQVDKYMLQKKEEEDKRFQEERAAARKAQGLPPIEETEGDVHCDITDLKDGTYKVEYCARLPGTYELSVQVGYLENHVKKSPKKLPVRWRCPNAPCAHTQKELHTEIREMRNETEILMEELRKLGGEKIIEQLRKDGVLKS